MPLFSLLYVSRSTIAPCDAAAVIQDLVAVSRARNAKADVTGCLIFGADRFAQILEGRRAEVQAIMDSISRDPRQTEITMLEQGLIGSRRFSGWSLGYAGPSLFVQRTNATPVIDAARGSRRGVEDLMRIMMAFRAEQHPDDAVV